MLGTTQTLTEKGSEGVQCRERRLVPGQNEADTAEPDPVLCTLSARSSLAPGKP